MSRVQLPNNEEAIIADFALESTAKAMLAQLAKLSGDKNFEKLVEHAKQAAKDQDAFEKSTKKFQQELLGETKDLVGEVEKSGKKAPGNLPSVAGNTGGDTAGSVGKAADAAAASLDGFNKGAATGEKIFANMYAVSASAIKGTITAITVYGGILIDSFVGLGSELNEMTKMGVGFTDGVGRGGMSAVEAMTDLSTMGIDAAGTLKNLSGVVQTMNKKSFVEFTSAFMDATNSGVELGMSLDDSVERMGAELQKRQAMGIADGMNQSRMNAQITRTIKTQQKYASVLGESVDNIVAFTDSLIQQTPVLTSSLLRFDKELRGKVISGITDFAGTMRAMGGEEGGNIAAAMTEAAASGGLGFSDSMKGYVTALPSLQGPMNAYIKQIKNGTLSQEDAEQMALDMTSQLGNLSKAEKDRIFMLDRAGNAQAASMAKAIMQYEASAKKIKDLGAGLTMDGVQTGTNTLSKIMKQISGIFEGIKTGFLGGLGNVIAPLDKMGGFTKNLTGAFDKAQEVIVGALMPAIGEIFPAFKTGAQGVKGLTDGAKGLGEKLGTQLIPMIGDAANWIAKMISKLPEFIEKLKDIGAGIVSFGKGFMTVMSVLSIAIGPVMFVLEVLATTIGVVVDALAYMASPFIKLGSWMSGWFGDVEGEGVNFANMLGKLAGGVTLAVLAFKAVSGVLGLFGKSMPKMFANMGKSMMSGAKNMMGGLAGKLNKATGGKLDKVFSSAKDKIAGKAKEMDVGGKAMDAAKTKSKSFTKSLAGGMKDISKGIGSMLNNLSKGIGSVITNLAKAVGKAGAALGKGLGDMVGGALKGIGKGLAAIGSPKALLGTVVLAALGASMFIAGKAFQQFADINWAGVGMGMLALGALGVAAALIAPMAPVIAVGALAIGALGLALVPFAYAVSLAAPAMVELMGSFELLNGVDALNVALLGPALVSLAVGMAAFSAGGLVGGILDGLGSLLGQDSPFDKLAKIGAAAPAINEMTGNMKGFGTTVETFNDAMTQLDGAAISGEFAKMAEGIDTLNASMAEISLVSLMKMAAMKSFGPVQQEQEEPAQPEKPKLTDKDYTLARAGDPDAQARVDAGQTQEQKDERAKFDKSIPGQILADTGTDENPFAVPLEQAKESLNTAIAAQAAGLREGVDWIDQMNLDNSVKWAQMDLDDATKLDKEAATKVDKKPAEVDKEAATTVDRSPAGRAKRRTADLRAKAAQIPDNGTGTKSGTFVNGKLVAPIAAKTNQPAQASVTIPKPVLPTDATKLNEAGESTAKPETNKELFEQMLEAQKKTNQLLNKGNRITSDLSDEF